MEIIISERALKYLNKNDANSVIIYTIVNETSACCGGSTKKYYVPEVRMGFDNCNLKGYSVYYFDGFKILLSDKIEVNEEQLIVIDIEKILFIQKLILKGIDVKMI
ncbi:hypothetical protein LGK95_11385 [Clostridium algoriphilum]|uniref:hypothetical protein n=1 Tax=Clostridium algoriphilum TaxID=198347 RepID=UPI001CF5B0C1|nr:hypothetical protein [Clostridium algoriphilum]MCB2294121.1 hypothetical protein [Clostridium algoriphilum]